MKPYRIFLGSGSGYSAIQSTSLSNNPPKNKQTIASWLPTVQNPFEHEYRCTGPKPEPKPEPEPEQEPEQEQEQEQEQEDKLPKHRR